MRLRTHGRVGRTSLLGLALIVACFPLLVSGCGGDGDKNRILLDEPDPVTPPPPGTDVTAPVVSATPGTGIYGMEQYVTLLATDDFDPAPRIFYTVDGTIPTAASLPYSGPIHFQATDVLRFIAIDSSGNESAVGLEGYTIAPSAIEQQWAASGHADITGEPYRHWDADGEVPASCARCHSPDGFRDYAMDGVTDAPARLPVEGTFCNGCHQIGQTLYDHLPTFAFLEPVLFPSGVELTMNGNSNMCMTCHQGRASGFDVDAQIAAGPPPYSFINIHYYAAAASLFGGQAHGGYEYAGMEYRGRNTFGSHPGSLKTCVGCHMRGSNNDHHFLPETTDCTGCHGGDSFETLGGTPSSSHQGIDRSLDDLLATMQSYAQGTLGTCIYYNAGRYPYFFVDDNCDGVGDATETTRFTSFDAELLRAAYNYQVALKDPAGFVHNGTYIWQLLNDSIVALGGVPSRPAPGRPGFSLVNATKSQQWQLSGHADTYGEPLNHWNEDMPPEVPTSCAKCHSTPGFIDFVQDGVVDAAVPVGSLIECSACHQRRNLFADASTRYEAATPPSVLIDVPFPSGVTADIGNNSNLCVSCHQGRSAGNRVDAASPNSVVQMPVDYESYNFINRHYYAAGAIFLGSEVTAGYEYAGQTYLPRNVFPAAHAGAGYNTCIGCHMRGVADHGFLPLLSDCSICHGVLADFEDLGNAFSPNIDYDGNGVGESFQSEIDGVLATLYAAIRNYATTMLPQSSPVGYNPDRYPYWFKDPNGDGVIDPSETQSYQDFDIELLRGAYNYHSGQDPCSDIHHHEYVLQTLYDSADMLDDGVLNGSPPGTRP